MDPGKAHPTIDTALARLLHDLGHVELHVLQAGLEEVRQRRGQDPSVTLAGLLQARGQASAAVLESAVARLEPLDDSILANSLGTVDPNPLNAPAATRFGPYRVVRELARGGMGAVYEVVDERSDVHYALKTVLGLTDRDALARFKREVEALGRLDHPHVVRVHTAEIETSPPYLVQELLSGGTLADRLRAGPLAAEEVTQLGIKLCAALAHSHAQGVLHRDLKPNNVMLDDRGEPKLVDFGLVRSLADDRSRLTETGELLGTPGYLAPEQARAEHATDERTDVYGLAATLFALLSGRAPFTSRGLAGLAEVVTDPPPPLRSLNAEVPGPLAAVIERGLAKAPEARFADADAFAAALRDAAAGIAPPRSRQALWLLPALTAVLIVGAVAAGLARETPPAPAPSGDSLPPPETPGAAAKQTGERRPSEWVEPLEAATKLLRRQHRPSDKPVRTLDGLVIPPDILAAQPALEALAALNALDGTAPDLPQRETFAQALTDAIRATLPHERGAPIAKSRLRTLLYLLRLATRLPGRPPFSKRLWQRITASSFAFRTQGHGLLDSQLHQVLTDLDRHNLLLHTQALGFSDLIGGKSFVLDAAERLAEWPGLNRVERLVAEARRVRILGFVTTLKPARQERTVALATKVLATIETARREGWSRSESQRIPVSKSENWLENWEGLTYMARAQALFGLKRFDEAARDLSAASARTREPLIYALQAQVAHRRGKIDLALTYATQFLSGGEASSADHQHVVAMLWRIYLEHGQGLPFLRESTTRLLQHRAKPDRWICLVWLDHLEGDRKAMFQNLDTAIGHARGAAKVRLEALRQALKQGDPKAAETLATLAKAAVKNWW